jgi:hypothetical protein
VAQQTVKAKGHTEVVDAAVAATCTKTGLTEGKHCSVCKEVIEAQNEVPATGHKPGAEATCTNAQACEVCDTVVNTAKGHSDEDHDFVCDVCKEKLCTEHTEETISGTAATCEKDGLTDGKKCTNCGEILEDQVIIPATGHSYTSKVTAPTCTEQGYTTYTCENCDESYVDDYVATIEHQYGEWTQVKAPTTEETGMEERICACGDKEQREIDKLAPVPTEPKPSETQPTTPATKPGTTDNAEKDTQENGGNTIIIAVVAALGGLGIGGAAMLIVLKKKK